MLVYKITNLINNKIYIGQTIQSIQKRWNQHCHNNNDFLISRAIRKHGQENFKIEVLEECSNYSEINDRERFWIDYFNSMNPKVGYNITNGGWNYNHSQETKNRLSIAHKGKILSKEHKRKIGLKSKGRNNGMFGKKHSDETKRKIALKMKKGPIICNETGKIFSCIKKASEELNINRGHLSNVILGRTKSAKGLTFRNL